MSARHWTMIVTGVCLLIFTVWDSVMAKVNNEATLSAIVARWAQRPVWGVFGVLAVGIIIGAILGHLFWYQEAGS